MAAEDRLTDHADGFVGAMKGVTLADVIQMNGHNRFTGCMTLEYAERSGAIFFRDGEVIHAEQDRHSGEEAFYQIIRWPGGKFHLQPKVTTTSSSIKASLNHLLLEAMRLMDEENNRRGEDPPAPATSAAAENGKGSAIRQLQKIPGVKRAVVVGKGGSLQDDGSPEGEALAAEVTFLAMIAGQIGEALALGGIKSAAAHGKRRHLLLFESKSSYLGVAVDGESSPGGVEVEIRKAFTARK